MPLVGVGWCRLALLGVSRYQLESVYIDWYWLATAIVNIAHTFALEEGRALHIVIGEEA